MRQTLIIIFSLLLSTSTLVGKYVNVKWTKVRGVLFQHKVNGELERFEDYGEYEYGK